MCYGVANKLSKRSRPVANEGSKTVRGIYGASISDASHTQPRIGHLTDTPVAPHLRSFSQASRKPLRAVHRRSRRPQHWIRAFHTITHEVFLNHATIHPLWVRVFHWINAVAVILMCMSGWQVYEASPIFNAIRFPAPITLGGWLGGALLWHFAIMWILVANLAAYLVLGIFTGRLRRTLFPLTPRTLIADFVAALRGKLGHSNLGQYNA